MLTHLHITNYTIVDELEMEFEQGMTVITGETGAGKSILLDGLGLCLGDRADPAAVRSGCERAEITATFDIAAIDSARRWLENRELGADGECILRRVITREGRSRAFINGNSCTLQDCSGLGELLIDIHSQHAHQSLLRREVQRHLLDDYAGAVESARLLEQQASQWLRQRRELDELSAARDEQGARAQLLAYQVEELDSLKLQPGELDELEDQQKQLANAEQVMQATQQALTLCEAQEDGARSALQLLADDALSGAAIRDARELLDSAAIQLEEARNSLRQHLEAVEINPARLNEVEQRLNTVYEISRKHKVQAPELDELHRGLRQELEGLTGSDARLEELAAELEQLLADYSSTATKLSKSRKKAAANLQKKVGQQLSELAMEQCQLSVSLTPRDSDNPHPQGLEEVEFLVSTNPGQTPRPLGKIASGGELSRISLAIQVIFADANTVPSMVFDEVDVGIGGAVAEVVGKLLRSMAVASQVLCVTHLPQVAAQGQQHLQVAKSADKAQALAQLTQLKKKQRVEEIARMLGGIDITDKTRAAAREMLTTAD
jgi:DNA repair protein RecN (Recombination protein N)